MFKIGDYAILIDPVGLHTLQQFKSYKVIDIDTNSRGDQIIALDEDPMVQTPNDFYYYVHYDFKKPYRKGQEITFYNAKRFTIDIKPTRRKKLKKIFSSQQ